MQEEREFAYIAMGLLEDGVKFFDLSHIHRIERFIVANSWWDTVDGLATCMYGGGSDEPLPGRLGSARRALDNIR